MILKDIKLSGFKNYQKAKAEFDDHINCLLGENGMGKTNLLDAIHYLSLGKSAFNSLDRQNIRHDDEFFSIQGNFRHEKKKEHILCSLKKGDKKTIKRNRKAYERIKDHIGLIPTVLISPYDQDLINEGNETRRRFYNNILVQTHKEYLDQLLDYNRLLNQRNSLLKNSHRNPDRDLIESYNEKMIPLATRIYEFRKKCLEEFLPFFSKHYAILSDEREAVDIQYDSDLSDPEFETRFRQNLHKDLILQRTELGIHRDRYNFRINGFPVKKFGSQGQQKSFVIALKRAQFDQIREARGFKPILLLDDIFDKLDDLRIRKLMQLVSTDFFGQLFVTDARPERTLGIFEKIDLPYKIFYIKQGNIEEV